MPASTRVYLIVILLPLLPLLSSGKDEVLRIDSCVRPSLFERSVKTILPEFLQCADLPAVKSGPLLGFGSTKAAYLVYFGSSPYVALKLLSGDMKRDFLSGYSRIRAFQSEHRIVKLKGNCLKKGIYFTEYHPLGYLKNALHSSDLPLKHSARQILGWCRQFADILSYFHSHPEGPFVFCDSNGPLKIMEQLLLADDFSLVAHDLDALPSVKNTNGIVCGHEPLFAEYGVAPEQVWPFPGEEYDEERMPGYGTASDVWKCANFCSYLVENHCDDAWRVRGLLSRVHEAAMDVDPSKRPEIDEIVRIYSEIERILD